ncbi:MAG: hydroxymethylbilane synthase [Acidimicrobiales bacterium]
MLIRVATRGSALAIWQAEYVSELLRSADASVEVQLVRVSTQGDRDKITPLEVIGGKGVFVKEVQLAVLDDRADIAVHSGKDLPAVTPDGLVVAAVPERGDPRDVLVGTSLKDLPNGATVATGSIRRRAQLASLRPDLRFETLRGNIETRLLRAEAFDAIVMAAAALARLELKPEVVDRLAVATMIPQVAQGAIAIECRSDDAELRMRLGDLDHSKSRTAFDTERSFLAEVGGDCELPIAGHAVVDAGTVEFSAAILSPGGQTVLTETRSGTEPQRLGRDVARWLLDEQGGANLLGRP